MLFFSGKIFHFQFYSLEMLVWCMLRWRTKTYCNDLGEHDYSERPGGSEWRRWWYRGAGGWRSGPPWSWTGEERTKDTSGSCVQGRNYQHKLSEEDEHRSEEELFLIFFLSHWQVQLSIIPYRLCYCSLFLILIFTYVVEMDRFVGHQPLHIFIMELLSVTLAGRITVYSSLPFKI